nr:PilZ domain-containing protein [Paracraurococcus ruber]
MRSDEGERRRFERIAGGGETVTLRPRRGGAAIAARLRDISRGGMAVAADVPLPPGTEVEADLPGAGGTVPARVARQADGLLALTFPQDAQSLGRVDRVLERLGTLARAA